jgi:hypothetical protein
MFEGISWLGTLFSSALGHVPGMSDFRDKVKRRQFLAFLLRFRQNVRDLDRNAEKMVEHLKNYQTFFRKNEPAYDFEELSYRGKFLQLCREQATSVSRIEDDLRTYFDVVELYLPELRQDLRRLLIGKSAAIFNLRTYLQNGTLPLRGSEYLSSPDRHLDRILIQVDQNEWLDVFSDDFEFGDREATEEDRKRVVLELELGSLNKHRDYVNRAVAPIDKFITTHFTIDDVVAAIGEK